MTDLVSLTPEAYAAEAPAEHPGLVAVFAEPGERLDSGAARVNRLMRGALARLVDSDAFARLKPGQAVTLAWPAGMAAEAVLAIRLPRKADAEAARKAGAAIGKALAGMATGATPEDGDAKSGKPAKSDAKPAPKGALILAGAHRQAAEIGYGVLLRAYDFADHRKGGPKPLGPVRLAVTRPDDVAEALAPLRAVAEGVFFTRDLVNAPANILTTKTFAKQLKALKSIGLEVEVLDEDDLAKLGMGALLAVGQGSDSPSKVVVMQWSGAKKSAPTLALIGKGVVFDTGGISIKPAGGMEEMTMDMAGAGVVAGVMKALALRKAKANVVGLVGLVENMPSGNAQRPGDVVTSMKGDTIEVINTDAEGRLVLADVMWYAQERFKPAAMIDLATLTGAIIIALGHENTGVFANDDALCDGVLKAAAAEAEGAWRMPLGAAYDKQIKSRIADMKNVGGRPAGAVTAAQFLQRFVKDGTPWVHLDIAGTASTGSETAFAPKGASGWGVRTLDRLVRDRFEG